MYYVQINICKRVGLFPSERNYTEQRTIFFSIVNPKPWTHKYLLILLIEAKSAAFIT